MTTRLWMHFWAALILLIPLGAQAVQDGAINDAGDIAFVAYHDNDDGFSFVLMDDAPHNTSIRFIDEEWTGAAFSTPTAEGDVLWTNTTGSTIAKGTVVDIVDADDNLGGIAPSIGTAVETDLGFGTANGDQIYAITGTRAAPGTFLAFVGESQDINGAETAVLTGTGLTAGTHAKLTATEGYYSGSTICSSTASACLQQINNAAWTGSGGFTYPADSPSAFSGTLFVSPVFTAATTTGAAFNTTNGTNLTPSFSFGSANETLTVADASHLAGATVNGGGGTDTLVLSNGHDISAATVSNFETLGTVNANSVVIMTVDQLNAFTSISALGTGGSRSIQLSSSGTLTTTVPSGNFFVKTVSGGSQTIMAAAAIVNRVTLVASDSSNDKFIITGSSGNQTISIMGGNNTVDGGAGNDLIQTGINGSTGNNTINGGAGVDTISTGAGIDMLTGGSENDVFRGGLNGVTINGDTITDIAIGDQIKFSSYTSTVAAVRFGATNNTLEIDIGGTDFSTIESTINMSNNPGTLAPVLISIPTMDGVDFTVNFVTDVTGPTLSSSSPADGAMVVAADSNITLTFNENIAFGTGNIQVIDVTDGSNSFIIDAASPGAQASISGPVLTINPSADIDSGTNYSVQIAATAIDDVKGNSFAGISNNTTLNFTTLAQPTVTATLVDVLQSDGNSNGLVNPGDTLRYTVVLGASVAKANGTLFNLSTDDLSTLVVGSVTSDQGMVTVGNSPGNTSVAVDVGSIASGASVTITFDVTAGLPSTSPDSISLQGSVSGSNFTTLNTDDSATGAASDATATSFDGLSPTISSISVPANGTYVVGDYLNFTVNFSENVTDLVDDSTLGLTLDSGAVTAIRSGDTANSITYSYEIVQGNKDTNGITVASINVGSGIQDAAGNAVNTTLNNVASTTAVLIKTTAPRITNIYRQQASPTNSDSVVWLVKFDQDVVNFDGADFTVGGTTATITGVNSTQPSVYEITASGGDLANFTGTATLGFAATQNITDTAGNALVNTTPLSANKNTYVLDNTAPLISDIFRATPTSSPTNADSLTWTIAFKENVKLFDVADILVTGTTATAQSINKIGESVYRVTVSGGDLASFNGTATLAIASGHNITDEVGNALTNRVPTVQNVNTFEVDNDAPTLVITGVPANTNAAFTATFTFSEVVTGLFESEIIVGNGVKSSFSGSGKVYTVSITPQAEGNVSIAVNPGSVIDAAGNTNATPVSVASNYDITKPAVTISGVPENSNAAFTATFTFNEAVTGFDKADIALGNATKGTFTATSATVYTLVVTPTGAAVTADVAANRAVDASGNGNTAASQVTSAFDDAAPILTIGTPSVATTLDGPVTYTLTYSNADNITLALGNITLIKTGSAKGTHALSGTGNTRTVTISDISGDGTLAISVAANTASDDAGNEAAAANSATITVTPNQTSTLNISGNTVVGETLVASLVDTDGLTDVTITYQWTSGSINIGTNSNSYTLQTSDVGKTISINAQYTDERGTAENITSAATAAIITLQTDAVNRISSTANQAGGTEPTVDDYKTAGITDVSDAVLTRILPLINSAIARQSGAADVDDVSKLQALVDAIIEGQDNDEDGLPNMVEGTVDTDNDGTTDREDTDSDNDGVADQLEARLTLTDSDSDGIIDVLDADVGNDGQVDTDKVDANFDGVDDGLDSMAELIAQSHVNAKATPAAEGEAELPFIQFDQDQDQRPNHLDLDSENDGVMDVVESGLSDTNGDGKLDTGDAVITDGSKLLDGDADSLPNMLEIKSDGISFDLIVNGLPDTLDTDANGILDSTIDMDRDGIIDSVDNAVGAQGTLPDIDGDGIPNHLDDDDDGDGIPDANENPQQQHFTGKDADADGIDDGVDQNINGVLAGEDLNNNGVRDDRELSDADNDGIADHLDADSGTDGTDGIEDNPSAAENTGPDVKSGGAGTMNIMMMLSLLLLSALRYSRSVVQISIALLLWLSATITHAQDWQVNLGLGQSSLTPNLANGLETSDGNDRAVQMGLGYRISSDWLVELRYSDMGEAVIRRNQRRSTLSYQSWALDTKYQLPFLRGTAWSPYVLGGIAINRLQADDLSLEKKTDPGLMLGTGISYRFQEFQLNSELIRYSDDISGWFMGIQKDF